MMGEFTRKRFMEQLARFRKGDMLEIRKPDGRKFVLTVDFVEKPSHPSTYPPSPKYARIAVLWAEEFQGLEVEPGDCFRTLRKRERFAHKV
jgi:hypothetical protein